MFCWCLVTIAVTTRWFGHVSFGRIIIINFGNDMTVRQQRFIYFIVLLFLVDIFTIIFDVIIL